jgi:hypothetical protein
VSQETVNYRQLFLLKEHKQHNFFFDRKEETISLKDENFSSTSFEASDAITFCFRLLFSPFLTLLSHNFDWNWDLWLNSLEKRMEERIRWKTRNLEKLMTRSSVEKGWEMLSKKHLKTQRPTERVFLSRFLILLDNRVSLLTKRIKCFLSFVSFHLENACRGDWCFRTRYLLRQDHLMTRGEIAKYSWAGRYILWVSDVPSLLRLNMVIEKQFHLHFL